MTRISPPPGRLRLTTRAPLVTIGYGAALLDTNTGKLTSAYRAAVAATLPDDAKPAEEWWLGLSSALADYFIVQEYDTERPPKLVRKAMQSISKKIDPLGEELRAIRRLPMSMAWGDASSQLLTALAVVRDLAAREVGRYDRMIAANRGYDPHQELLYSAVINLWDRLNKPVRFSRPKKTKVTEEQLPRGPLIRFFAAVVGPVLGQKMPGAHGIAEIIKRHRKAVRNGISKAKKRF